MCECRFYPWCSYIEGHGCTKDSCRHYQPMPDVDALLVLADKAKKLGDEEDGPASFAVRCTFRVFARSIYKALGEVVEE